jgi:hypothetical protein
LRRTKGWGKRADAISYAQIKDGTGIKSDTTVSRAIGELLEMNCILSKGNPDQRITSQYALNRKYEIPLNEIYEVENEPLPTPFFGVDNDENKTATPNNGVAVTPNNGVAVEHETTPKNGDTKENKTISTNQDSTFVESESTRSRKKFEQLRRKVLEVTDKLMDWQRGTLGSLDERAIDRLLSKLTSDRRTLADVEIYHATLPVYFGRAPNDVTPPSPMQMHSNFDKVLRCATQHQANPNSSISLEELRRRKAARQKENYESAQSNHPDE